MPRDYDSKLEGKIEGKGINITYWTPESRKVNGALTLSADGQELRGPGRAEGTSAQGQFTFQKP